METNLLLDNINGTKNKKILINPRIENLDIKDNILCLTTVFPFNQ